MSKRKLDKSMICKKIGGKQKEAGEIREEAWKKAFEKSETLNPGFGKLHRAGGRWWRPAPRIRGEDRIAKVQVANGRAR